MNNCTFTILAEAAPAGDPAKEGGNPFGSGWIMILAMVVLFWVIAIRPQNKARKEHAARIAAIKKGDKVITNAGIHGTVVHVDDSTMSLQIADGVTIKVEKAAIAHLQKKEGAE